MITLSEYADIDVAAIYSYTAQMWDVEQAETYCQFLRESLLKLEETPGIGRPVANRRGLFTFVVTWKHARYGNRVIYEHTLDGIYVVRILHTAMNWQDHIP